jgi:dihydrofolate reductase
MLYWMNVSVDLFIEGTEGENGGGDWMRIGEVLHRDFNERAAALAAGVEGRKVYEIMEDFWPGARYDETLPDYLRDYGHIWVGTPKVLVSNSRKEAGFNTRVVGGPDAIEQLAQLRAETDGDIGVGGASIATQLLSAGLLDELVLYTHPAVLGSGRPLFDRLDEPLELDLLEQAEFEQGVTLHRYEIRRTS